MTKHLRLIMLSLLAMICLGGYSQSEEDFTTKTWSNPYLFEHYKIVGEQGGNGNKDLIPRQNEKSKDIRCYSDNKLTITSTQGKMKKIVFVLSTQGKQQCGEPTVDNGTVTRNPKSGTISEVIWEDPNGYASVTFTVGAKNNWGTNTNKSSGQLCFNKIIITDLVSIEDNRQDAGIRFAKDSYNADITGSTFNEAELVNPNGLGVTYEIAPTSEGVSITKDGSVNYPAVEATYTVTAKFAGNVTYKPATATYTLNVVDPNLQTRIIEFVAGEDKGNKGKSDSFTEGDIIEKDGISVNCDKARLGCTSKEGYRIYKDGLLTISTKIGDITKITFDDLGTADDLPNNLEPESGNYDKVNYVWTGKGKSIRFKVNVKAFLSKITVTVKVPVAKDYTLDENSVNTIEAYENANVTLKRTFYKDGEWNTLCLPFAVANAATAFDGAELREVDVTQSSENTIVFKKAATIEAGKPYLIKWAKTPNEDCDFVNTFEGVTLVATATPVKVNDAITFTGFYNKATADKLGASVAAIGAGNKLFKVTSGEMKGFRAAFVLNPATPAAGIKVVIDGTTTGIEDLVVDGVKANGRVYNLNGQFVGNSLNGLQPGLYIQNGKKIVVK